MKRIRLQLSLIFLLFLIIYVNPLFAATSIKTNSHTLILSSPNDPYYCLAKEIAEVENLRIYHTLDEIRDRNPTFLLWIISPESLSESKMIHFNKFQKEQTISCGIITGNTIDIARNLWLKAKNKPGSVYAVIHGRTPKATNMKKSVLQFSNGRKTVLPLNKKNILDNLRHADYFIYNGHSGPKNWVENIIANDIPNLNSCVIFSYGCDNMKLWRLNTIALSCINNGAIAYAGYLYASNASNIIGKYDGLNCQYTWDEFSIGHIAQIHNRELLKWNINIPYVFLIGDPRISFQNKPSYRLLSDKVSSNRRILSFTDAAIGFMPIRIPDGADYNFVAISGVTSSSYNDVYFNNRLQMINIQNDKFILFKNHSSAFTITLSKNANIFWMIKNHIIDAFDKRVETLQHPSFYPFLIIFIFIHFIILIIRKRLNYQHLLCSAIIGLFWLVLIGTYSYFRWNDLTITSKILVFSSSSVISYIGSFLFVLYGGYLFFTSKTMLKKIMALVIALFHDVILLIISILLPIFYNLRIGNDVFKIPLVNDILIFKMIFLGLVYYFMNKFLIKSTTRKIV